MLSRFGEPLGDDGDVAVRLTRRLRARRRDPRDGRRGPRASPTSSCARRRSTTSSSRRRGARSRARRRPRTSQAGRAPAMSVLATQVGALARRSVTRTARQPASAIPPLIFPVALMLINSGGLKASTQLPGFPTDSFLAFALAVPFIQGALFSTMNAGTDLARDIQTGFFSRLSLTPDPRRGAARRPAGGDRRPRRAAGGLLHRRRPPARRALRGRARRASRLLLLYAALVSLGFGALGSFLALRTGSGEAIQALFPALFVFLFISSMNTPRNLIAVDWFRFARVGQPRLVPDRVRPQPDHHRLGRRGARARLRDRDRARGRLARAAAGRSGRGWSGHEDSGPSPPASPGGR